MLQLPPFRYLGNNAALYAGAAVPAVATDPYFANVVLLVGFDSTTGVQSNFTPDDSITPHTITSFTNEAGTISTAQSKFGGASGFCNNTRFGVTLANDDFEFGTGDFTVECWIRPTVEFGTSGGNNNWWGNHGGSNGLYVLQTTPAGKLFFTARIAFGNKDTPLGATTLTLDTWYHVAVARQSGTLRVFLNGVVDITDATWTTASLTHGGFQLFCIGGIPNSTLQNAKGYIDEFRVTKGFARYGAAGFAVPTAAFPRVAGPVTITSGTAISVNEGTTAVATLTATPGTGTITWSFVGGADVAKFSIDASSGALSFNSAPDFEAPTDANLDNVYVVQVQASDGTTSDTRTLSVTVVNLLLEGYQALIWGWYTPETLGAGASAVAQWDDVGPAASRHATQATSANQPIVVASAINGLKAIRIVDATDGLALPSMAALTRGATFLVLNGDFDGGAVQGFPVQPIAAGEAHYPYADNHVYCGWMKNDRPDAGDPSQALNAWHILSIHSAPSDYRIYINNVLLYSSSSSTPTFSSAPFIGKAPAGSSGWLGQIAEVVQFSDELTTTDRTTEYNRLKAKFGL